MVHFVSLLMRCTSMLLLIQWLKYLFFEEGILRWCSKQFCYLLWSRGIILESLKEKKKKATNQQGKYNVSIILYVKVIFFRWCVFLNVSLFLTLFYVALGIPFFIAKGGLKMQSPQCGRWQALLLGLCGQLQSDFRGTRNAASDADGISLCCDCTALQWNGFNLIIWLFHFAYIYNLPDLWGKGRTGSQSCWRHFERSEQYSVYHYNSQALQFGDSALTTKIGRRT